MEKKEYITLRAVPLGGDTVPAEAEITLTQRQAEFLVLGGFIELKPIEEKDAPEEAETECSDGTI